MAFDSGNPSFRVFWYKEPMTEAVIGRFADAIAPDIKTLSTSPIEGWMSWRHLLDREITPENCFFIPWLLLNHLHAERKVPKPLFRAYCKLEEAAEMRARGLESLPRKLKAEIKERVMEALQPEMPPTLTGIATVVNFSSHFVYADAMKQTAAEAFMKCFKETTDHGLALMTPHNVALLRKQVNDNDLEPAVFTADETVPPPERCNLGQEFLTWLWFRWETRSGDFDSRIGERCQYMLEGPVTFFNEGKGAHNVVLRNGLPLQSREAGAALLCGKKVSKIAFTLADTEKVWTASVDAEFAIRSLKLPKDKEAGPPTFQERMELTDKFVDAFFFLFETFLVDRADGKVWKRTEKEMKEWVNRRATLADGDATEH